MAYRPDGGTVLPAKWGCGSALAGAEAGGCGPSPHLLTPAPSPGGELGFFGVLSLLFASSSGFSGSGVRMPSVQIPALPLPCCVTSRSSFTSLSSVL